MFKKKKNKNERPTVDGKKKLSNNNEVDSVLNNLPQVDATRDKKDFYIPTGASVEENKIDSTNTPSFQNPANENTQQIPTTLPQTADAAVKININNTNVPTTTSNDNSTFAPVPGVPVTPPVKSAATRKVEAKQKQRKEERKKNKRRKILRTFAIILAILLLSGAIGAYVYFYVTDAFKIEHININGVEHLTDEEMYKLADVPEDTTLLKVDTETIIKRLKRDAWIHDVNVDRSFPNTLTINVTERSITAIVEVPTSASKVNTAQKKQDSIVRNWAISADHVWLMPVPDKNSEAAKSINPRIYNDVEGVMHIIDVSPSVQPDIGGVCTDEIVNCAIDVVASMTTELREQVKAVKATDSSSTTLLLKNGVEVSIGTSDDIRDKERVVLELLKKYDGKISYINVRNVSSPTWRMI